VTYRAPLSDTRTIAIVGAGPAGSALATFLRAEGLDVVLFAHGKRPPLIVGESLVPACIPFIRRLGIEDEISEYSTWKGGATFIFGRDEGMSVRFDEVRGAKTTYSYNVPRDRFDASCLEAARRSGARIVTHAAVLERDGDSDRVRLADASLAAAGLGARQPDFIVDTGGRRRIIPRLLGIPTDDGERRDVALHAHFEGIEVEIPGNVHTDRLEHGWLWRIPLPGRVSMGVVIDSEYIRKFGDTAEEQLDNFLASDPVIRDYARPARRVTPVVRYGNYQSISRRAVGENWALAGDSFGFVDPVFSSGMLIAFQAADWLAEALRVGTPDALTDYERRLSHHLACWQRVTGWYYDGRILTLFKVGNYVRSTWPGRLMDFHFRKHMPRIFTGENATHPYSQWLIQFMVKYGLAGNDSAALRIR
jgi:flavin-dependent dehydrogenase